LDKPRYAPLLRIYAGLTIKHETLLANINARYGDDLLDELGHAIPALETLQRLAKACASIGTQLGLAPGAERAMRHGLGVDASNSKWLALANGKYDEEVVPVTPFIPPPSTLQAEGYLVLEFYSGAAGPSGRFTEGFSLRRLHLIHRTTLTRFTRARPCALKPGPAHATLEPSLRHYPLVSQINTVDTNDDYVPKEPIMDRAHNPSLNIVRRARFKRGGSDRSGPSSFHEASDGRCWLGNNRLCIVPGRTDRPAVPDH